MSAAPRRQAPRIAQFTSHVLRFRPPRQSHGVLSNTAIVWTFLLSAALRLDNFTAGKAVFCLLNFAGVAFDAVARNLQAPDETEARRWWGAFLALGSALFFALSTCMVKSLLPDDSKVDMVSPGGSRAPHAAFPRLD